MKAVLRGIVSMAFSTIEDQNTQHRVPLKPKTNPDVSRPSISPPLPVPADEIYKPLSSSDPVPFGAVTKIESTTTPVEDPQTGNNLESVSAPINDIASALMAIVSEKTGYPQQMLEQENHFSWTNVHLNRTFHCRKCHRISYMVYSYL